MKKKEKSKGNFVDFINDASKPGSTLAKKFFDEVSKPGITAVVLKMFFDNLGYDGVSLDDCKKILSLPKDLIIGRGKVVDPMY